MERTFEYRMRPNTTQESTLFREVRWYRQCICTVGPQPLPATQVAIGLDIGLTCLVADSEGHTTDHPKAYHHTIPRNAVADVGRTSRNLSLHGRIFAPTAAS